MGQRQKGTLLSSAPLTVPKSRRGRRKAQSAMKKIGYARVSTDQQNLSLQIAALNAAQCDVVLRESGRSGATMDRPYLRQALALLNPGDTLVVWRLDRLGRSLLNLVELINDLGQRGIEFHSLTENIDTRSSGGRLVFHMMAALAEFERSLISERTKAGMYEARAQGRHLGRPPLLTPQQQAEAVEAIIARGQSVAAVAKQFRVAPRTLHRILTQKTASRSPGNPLQSSQVEASIVGGGKNG